MKSGRRSLPERLWARVDRSAGPDGCWLWQGGTDKDGYGKIGMKHSGQKAQHLRTHRLAWELENGPIPNGLLIRHKCDMPACVNPKHLCPGTTAENVADRVARGRSVGNIKARGENSSNAKLTWAQAALIRQMYRRGKRGYGCPAIGKRFGVGKSTIERIVSGAGW